MKNDTCFVCGKQYHNGIRAPTWEAGFCLHLECLAAVRRLVTPPVDPQDAREGSSLSAQSTIPPSPALPHEPGGLESRSGLPGDAHVGRALRICDGVWVSARQCAGGWVRVVVGERFAGEAADMTPEQADWLADVLRQAAAGVRGEPAVPEPGTEAPVQTSWGPVAAEMLSRVSALSSAELTELVRAAKHELHRRAMKRANEYF